jgi:thiol-disulfide isomerase/thioredoxin
MTRRGLPIVLILAAVALSSCGGAGRPAAQPASGSASCLAAQTAPAAFQPTGGNGQRMPDVALPCFDGGGTVQLGQLRGPAVVNLWGSWCEPCRTELPAFERYARRAAGHVMVIGVDSADTPEGGGSIIKDMGLTFPNLFDDDSALATALGRFVLPITLFVDADGRIAFLYNGQALDDQTLARLVEQHLRVVVPA